jgi:23S rRNA (cytidine1920-2'-O)/16S rRNA (cytidine1409-2'-O)-methyltransferase
MAATPTGKKVRLDQALVERGLAESRAKAQALVLSGRVRVGGTRADKCGRAVRAEEEVSLSPAPRPFASRGGGKLDGALSDLGVSPEGEAVLDVGASTGGFTDCLLRRGALRVYAVDVGEKLLDDRLRRDPRVVSIEGVNFRLAAPDLLPERLGLAVVDVSFISLRHILTPLRGFLLPGGRVLALVKPQFEAGRGKVGKGGVVRDDAVRHEAVRSVAEEAAAAGFLVEGEAESRLAGPAGNREVFLLLRVPSEAAP